MLTKQREEYKGTDIEQLSDYCESCTNDSVIEGYYRITAHGIYRCVKYLLGYEPSEKPEYKNIYSYHAIRKNLRNQITEYTETGMGYGMQNAYNGYQIWRDYFLKDPLLRKRIEYRRITSIDQLHWYANEYANRR